MVKVSINKDAAGVIKVGKRRVRSPVFVATASPIASLFKTFNGCVCSGNVRLTSIRRIVLAKIKDTFIGDPLCKLPAHGASRFVTGNLKTERTASVSRLVMIDVNANASFIGVSKSGIRRVNNLKVNKNALRKLSELLLGARSVRRISRLTRGKSMAHIGLRVNSVYGATLPSLPIDTATSLFKGTSDGTSRRSVTYNVVCAMLRAVKKTTMLSTLGDPVGSFILVKGLARLPRYQRIFSGVRTVCRMRFRVPPCTRCEATVKTTLTCMGRERK